MKIWKKIRTDTPMKLFNKILLNIRSCPDSDCPPDSSTAAALPTCASSHTPQSFPTPNPQAHTAFPRRGILQYLATLLQIRTTAFSNSLPPQLQDTLPLPFPDEDHARTHNHHCTLSPDSVAAPDGHYSSAHADCFAALKQLFLLHQQLFAATALLRFVLLLRLD